MRVYLGRDPGGRKRYVTKTVRGTKRDAEAALIDLLREKNGGSLAPRTQITLAELADEWLRHKVRDVGPRTLGGYREALQRYVLPSLGMTKIVDLSLRDVDWLIGLMLSGELPQPEGPYGISGEPLGGRTVRQAHSALSQALALAIRWGWLAHNPAREATLPPYNPKRPTPLSPDERRRFLKACNSSFYGGLYHLLIDTGLRPGEAMALKWEDVDLARKSIRAVQSVTRGSAGEPVFTDPKTPRSRRTIPMLDGLRDRLLAHREWQRSHGLDATGLVFTTSEGRPLRPWTFTRRDLKRTATRAGITKTVTMYVLRHTFATLHLATGTPLKGVSDLMGHSTIQQTADTYMHADVSMTEDWMARFGKTLDAWDDLAERTPPN
ncbi:MAG: tyrosine-type recombinase/integrase [Trueperaceae bacterium]|nr:tyrosine-type recombinase/integrase [Trueperaceae bacterium]